MNPLLQQGTSFQAERRPHASAVIYGSTRLSYGELEKTSTQLAKLLKEVGCKKGDRVCILMPKSLNAIVGILGTLKADCIYVPIDPQSPAARVVKIITQCEPRVILGDGQTGGLLEEVVNQQEVNLAPAIGWLGTDKVQSEQVKIEFTQKDYEGYSDSSLDYQNTPEDPAYLMFTSGSTGVPKGVVITHANVQCFLQWAIRYFGMEVTDKMSAHPPLHFDLSVFDIFGALHAGAELHLVPYEINFLANKLADFIRSSELTHWFSVPSVLNYMAKFDVVKPGDFPTLKRILWCGEVFPTSALIHWMNRLPHVAFTNLYGPTEATIASSYYTVPACPEDEKASIPIGRPCDGENLLVLDESLRPKSQGEIGALYIQGSGLSPGYWRDPDKTRAAFLPNPQACTGHDRIYKTGDLARVEKDGLVYFHGRSDSQIKSRGYRIELGEIETALNALGMLQECAVVAINTDGFEGATIGCAYVPSSGEQVEAAALRKALANELPQYMIPTRWLSFAALPKNASGKTDRPKLREYFSNNN